MPSLFMLRPVRVLAAFLLVLVACLLPVAGAEAAQPGALAPLAGAQGCWTDVLDASCSKGNGLAAAGGTAVSADGRYVYVTGQGGTYGSLAVFRRKRAGAADAGLAGSVGSLTQIACYNRDASNGCGGARGMRDPAFVTVSSDGANVYVGTSSETAIAVFQPNGDGTLSQPAGAEGCLAVNVYDGCGSLRFLSDLSDIVITRDGKNVYASSWSSEQIAVLSRNTDPGAGTVGTLLQLPGKPGCVSPSNAQCTSVRGGDNFTDLALSPDPSSQNLYAAGFYSHSIAGFKRNADGSLEQLAEEAGCVRGDTADNRCATQSRMSYPESLVVSPNGEQLYVASRDGVHVVDRQPDGSMQTRQGSGSCLTYYDTDGACDKGRGLYYAHDLEISPDGTNVYVGSTEDNAVASFSVREDGGLRRLVGTSSCISRDGGYSNPHGGGGSNAFCATFATADGSAALDQSHGDALAMAPDGLTLYVAARDTSKVAVLERVPGPAAGAPTGRTWDFAEDMKTGAASDNPADDRYGSADVWSYGYFSTETAGVDGSDFTGTRTLLETRYSVPGQRGWHWAGDFNLQLAVLDNVNGFSHTAPGRASVLGWTNPYAGAATVNIAGQIAPHNPNCGDGVAYRLTEGATVLRSGTLPRGGQAQGFEVDESVAAGATVFLVLAPRASGHDCDGTEIDLRITGPTETEPQTAIVSGPQGLRDGRSHDFKLSSNLAAAQAIFECSLDGGDWTQCGGAAGNDNPYPRTHTASALSDGPHTLRVRAVNTGLNVRDTTPASRTFTIDDTDPETTITGGPTGRTRDTSPRFTFAASEAGRTECRLNGSGDGGWSRCFSPVDTGELAEGAHWFEVRATDKAGNVELSPARNELTVDSTIGKLQPGALRQLRGADACSSHDGSGGCRDDRRLDYVSQSAVSRDGRHVYAAGHSANALVVYDRAKGTPESPGDGRLTQKPGAAGCLNSDGSDGCDSGARALYGAWSVVVSPDDRHVYVASYYDNAIAVFTRDTDPLSPGYGTLTQAPGAAGCIVNGSGSQCQPARALENPRQLAISPDGRTLYAANPNYGRVAVLDRDTDTGALTQAAGTAGCISDNGAAGCADVRALAHPRRLTVSPDGRNLYVASTDSRAVATFARSTEGATLGDLTQLKGEQGCIREGGGERCRAGRGLARPRGVAVSPDGQNLYVASYTDGLAVLERDPRTGALDQRSGSGACFKPWADTACETARVSEYSESVAVSPDGQNVYVDSTQHNGFTVLRRAGDGSLTPLTGRDACFSENGNYYGYDRRHSCRTARGLSPESSDSLTIAPDGRNVYVASTEANAISVYERSLPTSSTDPQPLEWDAADDFVRTAPGANPGRDRYGNTPWFFGSGRDKDTDELETFRTDEPGYLRMGWLTGDEWFGMGIEDIGRFHMHPESAGRPAVLGWTNPLSTRKRFELHLLVEDNQRQGWGGSADGIDWHLEQGTTRLGGGTLKPGDAAHSLDREVELDPGETLWMTVGRRANYFEDSTYVDLHIRALDTVESAPQTIVAKGPQGLTNDASPVYTAGTKTAGATFECRVDGVPAGWSAGACGTVTDAPEQERADAGVAVLKRMAIGPLTGQGTHTFEVRAVSDGTPDPSPSAKTIDLDTVAPTVTLTSAPSGKIRDPQPRFEFTAPTSAYTECRIDPAAGAGPDEGWTECSSPRQLPELQDGLHVHEIRAADHAGNVGSVTAREFTVDTGAASLQPGALSQLIGDKGCISDTGGLPDGPTCADGRGLDQPNGGAFTSDGEFVYVASRTSAAVSAFRRNPVTGEVSQLPGVHGCVADNGSNGCTDGRALGGAYDVAVSPDDKHVYVAARDQYALAVFERNTDPADDVPDGALRQLEGEAGCLRQEATDNGCASARGLWAPHTVRVSPDGKDVYVGSWDHGSIGVFQRNTDSTDDIPDGSLTQRSGSAGCWSDNGSSGCADARSLASVDHLVVAPNGKHVYATGHYSQSVAAFERKSDGSLQQLAGDAGCVRNDGGEGCADVRSMSYPRGLAISPDGENVYVASEGDYAITVLRVEPDGGLSQESGRDGCYRYDNADGCRDGERLDAITGVAVSPDGRSVYAVSHYTDAITAFTRGEEGRLRQLTGQDACWSLDGHNGRCRDGKGLNFGWGNTILIPKDGRHVLSLAADSDAIDVFARKAPSSPNAPDDLVWDLARDFRGEPSQANPSPDRFGNDDVWQYRKGAGATGPGAGGDAWAALGSFRPKNHFCNTGSWLDSASDDHPFIKPDCEDRAHVHPDDNEPFAAGWRNPLGRAVTVNVSMLVEDPWWHAGGNGIRWSVLNGDPAAGGETVQPPTTLNPNGRPQNLDASVEVKAGDTLWFVVDSNGGDANADSTVLDVTISGVDETGPQTTLVSRPANLTTQARPEYVVGSQSAATFACRIDGAAAGFTAEQCGETSDPAAADVAGRDVDGLTTVKKLRLPTLADAAHTIEIRATSGSATDASPAIDEIRIDSSAPNTIVENGPDGLTRDRTPRYEMSLSPVEQGSYFECRVDEAGDWSRCASPFTLPELTDGAHVFEVRAVDRIGNRDATPERRELQVDTAPSGLQFGGIMQLPGAAGCVSQTGLLPSGEACTDGRGLDGATAVTVSSDGRFAYVASHENDAVSAYSRAANGALTPLADTDSAGFCISDRALTGEGCVLGRGLSRPTDLELSPDGAQLYVSSYHSGAIAVIDVDATTGAISQRPGAEACIGSDGDCTPRDEMYGLVSLEVTADKVYAATEHYDSIVVLDRDPATGGLSAVAGQAGCVNNWGYYGCLDVRALDDPSDLEVVGGQLYATSYHSGVAVFDLGDDGSLDQPAGDAGCVRDRDMGAAEGCRQAVGVGYLRSLAAAPSGTHLYTGGEWNSVGILARDAETGELTQSANPSRCVSDSGDGSSAGCDDGRELAAVRSIEVAHDGRHVYVASDASNGIATFRRSADGTLRQLTGLDGCTTETGANGTCRDGRGLDVAPWAGAVAVSPDNASVYVAGRGHDAVAAFARRIPRSAAASVSEWDAAEDFDSSEAGANPAPDRGGNADVWTYLEGNGKPDGTERNPSTYTRLPRYLPAHADGRWSPVDRDYPWAALETGKRGLFLTPEDGQSGKPAVLRWRSPADEAITVQMHLNVSDANPGCGDGIRWIAERGTLNTQTSAVTGVSRLGGGWFGNGGRAQTLDRTLTVEPNEIVDVVVTNRTGGHCSDDTRVDWQISALPLTNTEITEVPPALTRDDTPSFRVRNVESDAATFQCIVRAGTSATPPAEADWSGKACSALYEAPELADGRYVFFARSLLGGVAERRPATYSFKVDSTAPAVTLGAPPADTNDTTPSLAGAAGAATTTDATSADNDTVVVKVYRPARGAQPEELLDTRTITRADTAFGPVAVGTSLAPGRYIARAEQEDAAGNRGVSADRTFRVDTTRPVVAITHPDTANASRLGRPTITGTAGKRTGAAATDPTQDVESRDESQVTVQLFEGTSTDNLQVGCALGDLDGDCRFTGTVLPDGTFTATLPAERDSLLDGIYTARVVQRDVAGNESTAVTRSFKVDTVAPTVASTEGGTPGPVTRDRTPSFSGRAGSALGTDPAQSRDADEVRLRIFRGTSTTGTEVDLDAQTAGVQGLEVDREGDGDFSFDGGYPELADGTYHAVVEQSDLATNVGRTAPGHTFKVDRTPPQPTADGTPSEIADAQPSFGGTAGTATGDEEDRSRDLPQTIVVHLFRGTGVDEAKRVDLDPEGPGTTRSGVRVPESTSWIAGGSPMLADGTYTVVADQTDAAGNSGLGEPFTFKIDTAAPSPTVGAVPAKTADRTPALQGTAGTLDGTAPDSVRDLDTVTVRVARTHGDALVRELDAGVNAQTGAWSAAPDADLPDGTYAVSVIQEDNVGNIGDGASAGLMKVDATGPVPVVHQAFSPTSDDTPTVNGTYQRRDGSAVDSVMDHSPVEVRFVRTHGEPFSRTVQADEADGEWSATPSTELPDGTYSVTATQRDELSNEGTSTPARTIKIDSVAPLPVVDAVAAETNDRSPSFAGDAGNETGADPDAVADASTVSIVVEGISTNAGVRRTLSATRTAGGRWTAGVPDTDEGRLPDGTYRVTVAQRDAVDNDSGDRSPRTFKVDATAPQPTVDADIAGPIREPRPFLYGTRATQAADENAVADRAALTVEVDPVKAGEPTITKTFTDDAGEGWSTQLDQPLADGSYDVTVVQRDLLDNERRSTPARRLKIDTTAPAPTLTQPAATTRDRRPTLSGTRGVQALSDDAVPDRSSVTIEIDPMANGLTRTQTVSDDDDSAAWSAQLADPLADGTYELRVLQSDTIGNERASSPARTIKVDGTAPTPAITTAPAETGDSTPRLAGTAGRHNGDAEDSVADAATVTITAVRNHGHAATFSFEAQVDPVTGAWSGDLPAVVDGTYDLRVAQSDVLGNDRTVVRGATMKVDTVAPTPTIAGVTSPTDQRRPTFGGTYTPSDPNVVRVADRRAVEVLVERVGGSTVVLEAVEADDGSWTATPTGDLADGTYRITARQSDAVDNVGSSEARTLKVDDTAPQPTVHMPPSETSDRTPSFSGNAGGRTGTENDAVADAAQVTVVVEKTAGGGDAVRRELTANRLGVRWDLTLEDTDAQRLPDGTYTVTVAQKDALDNDSGPRSASTFKVDGTAPAPTVDASVAGATKDRRPAFTGTRGTQAATANAVEDSPSLTLTVDPVGAGATKTRTFTDDAGESWSAQLDEPLADGSYDVTVTQADGVSNSATSTVVRRIKIDGTAPAPTLAQPESPTRDRTPALAGTRGTQAEGLDAVADVKSVKVEIDPLKAGEATRTQTVTDDDATGDWAADITADLPDGSYDVSVIQADALGNEARGADVRRVKVDRTAPAPTLTDPPARTKERRPVLGGRAGDNAETESTVADRRTGMTLRITRTSTGASFDVPVQAAEDHAWSAAPDRDLVDGTYSAKILQLDALGNEGESPAKTFKVDRTAPLPTITSGSLFGTRTPTFGGAKGADVDGEDRVGDVDHLKLTITRTDAAMAPIVREFDDQTGTTWSRALDAQLADGSYSAIVEQSDDLGNPGASSPPHAFRVDATAPAPTVDGGAAATNDDTPEIGGDAGDAVDGATSSADLAPVTVTVRRKGSSADPVVKTVTAAAGRWTAQLPELADGTYVISAKQSDTAGNTGESQARELEIDSAAPAVALTAPADTRADRPVLSGTGGSLSGAADDSVADGDVSIELTRPSDGTTVSTTAPVAADGTWSRSTPSALPAGRWRVVVSQTDAVGNRTTADAAFFDVDRAGPALTVDALDSPSRESAPTIRGNGGVLTGAGDGDSADDRTVTVTVARGGTEVRMDAETGDDGRWSATVPDADRLTGDGTWIVTATQEDAAGNVTQATRTFVLDTTAPATTIGTAPGAFTADATPRFTFTADEAVSRFECSVDDAAFAACPTPVDLGQQADGAHTLRVRAVDLAGNTDGSPASHDFVVDTVRPSTSIATAVKGGEDEYNKLPVSFTASSNEQGTFECRLVGPGSTNEAAAFGDCAATKVYTSLDDGRYRFEARAVDRAGNRTEPVAAHGFNVDTIDPDTTLEATWPKTLTNDSTPEIRFGSPSPDRASFQCRVDGTGDGGWATCASGDSLAQLGDGSHTVEVRAVDRAGNVDQQPASRTFTVDTRAPETTVTQRPAALVNGRIASFRFASDEAGSTFTCRLDGATEYTICPAEHAISGLGDGEHTLRVRAVDGAGNEDEPITETWTVDATAPQPTVTAPSAADLADRRPALGGAAGTATTPSADASTVTVHLYRGTGTAEGDRVLTLSASRDGASWTATPAQDLADGTYTAQAVQTDAAGNRGESATRRLRIDATAPAVAWTTAAGPVGDSTPKLDGTAGNETGGDADAVADATTIPVTLRRAADATFALDLEVTRTAGGAFSVTVPGGKELADGTYVATATQEDTLGNESDPATVSFVVDTAAPVVSLTSAPRVKAPAFTLGGGTLGASESRSADASAMTVRLFQGTGTGGTELTPVTVQREDDAFAFAWPQGRPSLTDGTYTAVAEQRDGAQNKGASEPVTFTVDNAAPTPTVTSFANPTNDRTPALRGTLSGGAGDAPTGTVEFAKNLKTYTFQVTADDSGAWVVDDAAWGTDALAENDGDDGDWTVRVRQTDGAGNAGTAERTLRYDRTPPAVGITAGPTGTTRSTSALFVTNREPGATITCTVDGAARSCTDALTVAAGAHTFVATATDAAGNTATATREWTVDTSSGTQTVEGDFPAGAQATVLGTGAAPTSDQPISLALDLPTGVGGAVSVTEQPAPSISPLGGFQVVGRQLSITAPAGTAANPLRFVIDLDSSLLTGGVTWENVTLLRTDDDGVTIAVGECGSVPCIDDREQLPGGDARLVVLTDHASLWTVAKDNLAPTASVTDGPTGEVTVQEAAFRFTASEAAAFQCRMDDGAFTACESPKVYTGLAEGEHRFEVRAIDRAGNVGSAASRTFTVRLPKVDPRPADDTAKAAGETPTPPAGQPKQTPQPKPGPAALSAAQMQAMAQRVLKTSAISALRLNLGGAKAYGRKTISGGRLTLKRKQTRAPLFAVVCPVACRVTATPEVTVGRRRQGLPPQRMTFAGAGAGVVALRLPAPLAKQLRRVGRGKLTVAVEVTDTAGNRVRASHTLALVVRKR